MFSEKIRRILARFFLSRLTVRSLTLPGRTVEIFGIRREPGAHSFPLLAAPEVLRIFPKERKTGVAVRSGNKELRRISVRGGAGMLLKEKIPGVHGHLLGRNRLDSPGRILPLSVFLRCDRDRIASLPHERTSRLSRLKIRPAALRADEIPLALYYPILEKNLEKSILNKENGTLLLWYNSTSRISSSRALLLLRRTGREGGLEWRWISPD